MVAKLIVWDADRERATRRMARALKEFEIEGLKTLIPFHKAIMASEQWAKGETCRDLIEDRQWLKSLAFPKAEKKGSEDDVEVVARDYVVEVSGKRFSVTVHGEATGAPVADGAGPAPKAAPKRERKMASHPPGGGSDTLASPMQGNVFKVLVQKGASRRRGCAGLHHRGDEDGERDHRPQGGQDHRAADLRGRRRDRRRHAGGDQR